MPYDLPPEEFFPPHHRRSLFYSEAWQDAWLKAYGDHPNIQLHPDAGIYTYRQWLKRIIPVRSATLIGATSPATRSIRAEYTCLTDDALSASLVAKWDQLVLPDILEASEDERRVQGFAKSKNLTLRLTEREPAYAVDLRNGSFDNYLAQLGRKTRLSLYNRRKRLKQKGTVSLENCWPERERFYSAFNNLHEQRWGRPCYAGKNKVLIDLLLTALVERGCSIDMSLLSVDDKPVAAILDIQANGRCYNLQSCFDDTFDSDVSLGLLHLGYKIEQAFERDSDFYDFMAGSGKATDYKAKIATAHCFFKTISLAKSPHLKALYRLRSS
ncbi:GNAT family N-acetyltransferase [Marinimicrobium agarilyticum]|uniref:GNAT family N-acetyltransferase n=1 Tax=Marinimicrobium agarilyticum TaxID=306546 RepID=UPI00041C4843|nr:GNAT family N-acetyltransferase [Marinimicrobium agarilyticum]